MKLLDYIIIGMSIAIAIGLIALNGVRGQQDHNRLTASIYIEDNLYKKVYLDKEQEIKVKTEHGYNIIKIEEEEVSMIDADCPDQICIYTAPINKPGQIIVCLPHKVYVEIDGEKETNIDAVSN